MTSDLCGKTCGKQHTLYTAYTAECRHSEILHILILRDKYGGDGMKKRNSVQQKMTEFEYESTHRCGRLFRIQKSLKELEKLLGGSGKKRKGKK